MNFKYYILFSLLVVSLTCAQDDKYTKAMEKNLVLMDSASTPVKLNALANSFERIAAAEKDKWLPYYYAAHCLIIASFVDSVTANKDPYLDRAEKFVIIADSLQPNNSEIYTINGFLAQGRLVVDPMARWQKYGQLSNMLFEKAKELNPLNPRPEMLIGNTLYNTPEAFGGGKKSAEPVLKAALEKYKKFVPETSISPRWGEDIVIGLLKTIE